MAISDNQRRRCRFDSFTPRFDFRLLQHNRPDADIPPGNTYRVHVGAKKLKLDEDARWQITGEAIEELRRYRHFGRHSRTDYFLPACGRKAGCFRLVFI